MSAGVNNTLIPQGTLGQATSPYQRRFRRYGIKLPCRVKPRVSRKSAVLPELEVETLDVSGGGLFFLASAEWTVGTAIELELDLPAPVVRTPSRFDAGAPSPASSRKKGGALALGLPSITTRFPLLQPK